MTRAISAASAAGHEIDFTIFDDGSTDETRKELRSISAKVVVLPGTGFAYWARGMAIAERYVLDSVHDPNDLLLWLNDDVLLDEDCFDVAVEAILKRPTGVVVGATRSRDGSTVTYTGYRISGRNRLNLVAVQPAGNRVLEDIQCFNGNFVLLKIATARLLGGIEPGFGHAFADIEYGHRCERTGVPVLLAPSTIGSCDRDADNASTQTLGKQWTEFVGRKGRGHPPSVWLALRRSDTPYWPAVFIYVYVAWWARTLNRRLRFVR